MPRLTSRRKANAIKATLAENNPEALLYGDNAGNQNTIEDLALVGIGCRCGQPDLAVYSFDKLVEVFKRENIRCGYDQVGAYEAAVEWVDFNIVGGWLGDMTPIIIYTEIGL